MSSSAPIWLNEDFLKSAIQSSNPDYREIRISQFQVDPLLSCGDSYFSNIQRVSVEFQIGTEQCKGCKMALIVKNLPNTVLASFLKDAMHKEIFMYKTITPIMDKLLGVSLMPTFYFTFYDNILVLEDLLQSGYKLSDRVQQLDFTHCVASLEAVAMFHAVSIIINKKHPEYIEVVGKETYYKKEHTNTGKAFILNGFKLLADEIQSSAELAHLSKKLHIFGVQAWEKIVDVAKQEYTFCVLNHGDFWSSNIMFLYDLNGIIKNVKLLDLQFCRWTTPALDLQMFFNTSVRDLNCIGKLTEIYRNKLNSLLSEMDSSMYLSREQLDKDLEITNCYGLIAAVSLLPICVCDPNDPIDFQQTTNDDFKNNFICHNPYAKLYRGKYYRKLIPQLLNIYVDKAVI